MLETGKPCFELIFQVNTLTAYCKNLRMCSPRSGHSNIQQLENSVNARIRSGRGNEMVRVRPVSNHFFSFEQIYY